MEIRNKKGQFVKGSQMWLGKKLSDSHKKSMRKNHKGMFGLKQSEETKRKIGIKNSKPKIQKICKQCEKNFQVSPSQNYIIYCSKSCYSQSMKGKPSLNKGTKGLWKHTEEWKKLNSERQKGSKHWNWQGGMFIDPYPLDWTDDLKESIRKRDNYVCQLCGIHQDELGERFKKLDCHHIDYDKNNLNPKNLISLCKSCHMKTNSNRDYWINYFINYD